MSLFVFLIALALHAHGAIEWARWGVWGGVLVVDAAAYLGIALPRSQWIGIDGVLIWLYGCQLANVLLCLLPALMVVDISYLNWSDKRTEQARQKQCAERSRISASGPPVNIFKAPEKPRYLQSGEDALPVAFAALLEAHTAAETHEEVQHYFAEYKAGTLSPEDAQYVNGLARRLGLVASARERERALR